MLGVNKIYLLIFFKVIFIYIVVKILNKVWWFIGGSIVYYVFIGIIFLERGKKDLVLYLYLMVNF